jgi:hypothetical protein
LYWKKAIVLQKRSAAAELPPVPFCVSASIPTDRQASMVRLIVKIFQQISGLLALLSFARPCLSVSKLRTAAPNSRICFFPTFLSHLGSNQPSLNGVESLELVTLHIETLELLWFVGSPSQKSMLSFLSPLLSLLLCSELALHV